MEYIGFTLLALFILSALFVIGTLIHEHFRKQYTRKLDGTIYNYLGKIRDYNTSQLLYVLQSSETGEVVSIHLETLNKNFSLK